jgi:5-formyltetrahydrofolate cyclo-ligase
MHNPISKDNLRHHALLARDHMDDETRRFKSEQICKHVFEQIRKIGTDVQVLSYIAFRSEPDLYALHEKLWENGYRIAIPRVQLTTKQLDWRMLYRYDDLEPGYAGIMEPNLQLIAWEWDARKPVVILLPGLAFDWFGGRVGYGGGYYDRFAANYGWIKQNQEGVIKIAPAFSEQMVEQIPMDAHDIEVDLVVTEQGPLERNV